MFLEGTKEYRKSSPRDSFKLIKSGKQWLRAATSTLDSSRLLKVGQMLPSVSAQVSKKKHRFSQGKLLLKGIAAAGAVAGGRSGNLYSPSGRNDNSSFGESQVTANQDGSQLWKSVVLSAAPASGSFSSSINKPRVYKLISRCSSKHGSISFSITICISIYFC